MTRMSIYGATCTNAKCPRTFPYGGEVPAFCPDCGSAFIEKCTRCEVELQAGVHPNFCPKCGEKLRFDPDPSTGKVNIIIES
jgi:predicted RNA-binding Zn-ribbon protein involved in translation (DUF1610 family)